MHRTISKIFDEDQELSSQAKHPSEYTMLKHGANEIPYVPIEPNLLFFTDKLLQIRYFRVLYIDQNRNAISKEFGYNILSFYIYLTIFLLISLGVVISLFGSNKLSKDQLIFHVVYISIIFLYMYSILFALLKSIRFIYYNRIMYMILGIMTYLYMIFGTSFVLSGLIDDKKESNLIPMTAGMVGFTYYYRRILFDSYRHLVLTLIPILIIYLAINLVYNDTFPYCIIGEFAAIALFLITQIIESHSVENRTIQLFYRMEKEQESHFDDDIIHKSADGNENNYFNSVTELIISKCDFIVKEIKYATSVIIFKDVKNRLKNAQIEMNYIRSRVTKLDYSENFDLSSQDIDEQDKEFISQNFLKKTSLAQRQAPMPKSINLETITSNVFSTRVLIQEIIDYIPKVGQEWNFNIFYIKEKTGRSISVIATYLFTKLNIEDFLFVSEQEFFNYFDSLEKVNYI